MIKSKTQRESTNIVLLLLCPVWDVVLCGYRDIPEGFLEPVVLPGAGWCGMPWSSEGESAERWPGIFLWGVTEKIQVFFPCFREKWGFCFQECLTWSWGELGTPGFSSSFGSWLPFPFFPPSPFFPSPFFPSPFFPSPFSPPYLLLLFTLSF